MKIPRNGKTITRMSQPALPQPLRSRLRKMSEKILNSKKSHRIHKKKYSIVKNASSSGYCMVSLLPTGRLQFPSIDGESADDQNLQCDDHERSEQVASQEHDVEGRAQTGQADPAHPSPPRPDQHGHAGLHHHDADGQVDPAPGG